MGGREGGEQTEEGRKKTHFYGNEHRIFALNFHETGGLF